MALILETWTTGGTTQLRTLQPGVNTLVTDPGARYQLRDAATGKLAANLRVVRQGSDLVIDQIATDSADSTVVVRFADYYNVCSAVAPCDVTLPIDGGAPVVINASVSPVGALADGSFVEIENPRHLEAEAGSLRERQRSLSALGRARKISRRALKRARKALARAHAKIAARRKDFLHKLTARLAATHPLIATEALGVKGMTASARGTAAVKYPIAGATPGRTVWVDVTAVSGKTTWKCSTSFTPRRK